MRGIVPLQALGEVLPQDIEFLMPYPRKVAVDLSAGMERHLAWAADQGFLPSDTATERYQFSQHAEVGAWFCPEPETDQDLDLQLDVNGWYFVFDDAFDTPNGRPADGAVTACRQVMELLHGEPVLRPGASPLVAAFADLWKRECESMSRFWQQRASSTWRDYLAGNLAEEANRRLATPLSSSDYLDVRRRSVGVLPDFDMRECIGPFEVPPLAWYSSHLQSMRHYTVEHVIFVNDVCSLEKDEARDEINLVRLLMVEDNLSRQTAIEKVVATADSHMHRFQTLQAGIPHLCDSLRLTAQERTAVQRHLAAMIDMLSGNYHWSRSCGRYSTQAVSGLTPDQPGLLALHDLTRST